MSIRVLALLMEQFLQDLCLDRDIFALLFDLYVQGVNCSPVLLANYQSKVVFAIELVENVYNKLFTQLVLLVVLKVAIKYKLNAPLADHVVT